MIDEADDGLGWPARSTVLGGPPSLLGWPAEDAPAGETAPAGEAAPAEEAPLPAAVDPPGDAAPPNEALEVETVSGQDSRTPVAPTRESLVRDAFRQLTGEPAGSHPAEPPTDVSRETPAAASPTLDGDVSRETPPVLDTPIAQAAAAALRVYGPDAAPFPRPVHRRLVAVANQKGGVGKTTSAVNMAAALALRGARVLCIDLDPQGNASTALGVDHREGVPSIYDVLLGERTITEVMVATPIDGLRCVPATIDLAGAEIELVSMVARESRLQRALAAVEVPLDYVFIDCPPSLGLLTVNALVAAREMFIPIQCEYYALEGLGQLLRSVDLIRAHLNSELIISTILLTMYDGRTRLAEQVAREVRTHFGELVLSPAIPRSVRISEAPGYGQTVMTYDGGSRGAQAYFEAAREFAERGATTGRIAHD